MSDVKPYQPWGDLSALRMVSEGLSDAKKARCSTVSRVEHGAAADSIQGVRMIEQAWDLERQYEQMLMDEYKHRVPEHVREWAAGVPGMASGESFPRLIGLLGHPRVAIPHETVQVESKNKIITVHNPLYDQAFERSLRQLWSYAGCGDPARNPRDMVKPSQELLLSAGKRTVIRPILFSFSTYIMKNRKRFQSVADSEFWRVFAAAGQGARGHEGKCAGSKWPYPCSGTHKVHERECRNHKVPPATSNGCGTGANPEWGEPGSPWRPRHCLMHAHRMVAKEFLRQLWIVAGE